MIKNLFCCNISALFCNQFGKCKQIFKYGAENKNDNAEDVAKWASIYVGKAASDGIPCFWWDNGIYNQSGEKFAILDRKNLKWYREEVVDTIIRESYK